MGFSKAVKEECPRYLKSNIFVKTFYHFIFTLRAVLPSSVEFHLAIEGAVSYAPPHLSPLEAGNVHGVRRAEREEGEEEGWVERGSGGDGYTGPA